jgi:hypothetical protein
MSSINMQNFRWNFDLTNQTIPLFVYKQQKSPSPGFEPRTISQGCGRCSCNFLTKTNKRWSWLHSSTMLSFQDMTTTLTGFQTQEWPFQNLFLVSRNENAEFGANQYIHSSVISKHTRMHGRAHARTQTHAQTHNFNFTYMKIYYGF